MKKWIAITLALVSLPALAGCSGGLSGTAAYPKIEDLSWTFRDTVRYEEPAVAFDYTNNSDFTITHLDLQFKMKEGVTSEQLQLVDAISDALIPDEEIADMEPFVLDWIVCDPGETAENAICYMTYSTEATSAEQCDLMELNYAEIYYIGTDGKEHSVAYSAENGGYSVSETTKELFVWSDSAYAGMIPKPETRVASVERDDEECFYVEAYDISYDYYLEYIEACEQMGFVDDYPNDTTSISFSGTNSEGVNVSTRFNDYMQYMEITVEPVED